MKRICILQGSFSPLFGKIADCLSDRNVEVYKINFNVGDKLYSFFDSATKIDYKGTSEEWGCWFLRFVRENKIDAIFGHGDCHFYHREAINIAKENGIEVVITEEGYLRPSYITIEKNGVNAFSDMMSLNFTEMSEKGISAKNGKIDTSIKAHFAKRALFCAIYYATNSVFSKSFPNYIHRREASTLDEIICWSKTAWRKIKSKKNDSNIFEEVTKEGHPDFFLVPLQVYCDSQITFHSDFKCIEAFIAEVMRSFANCSKEDTLLVFKHHPYCIGFSDYTDTINTLAKTYGIAERVRYILGGHLPTMLKETNGVVTVNSTVGISAIHHEAPLMVMGRAFFDRQGLSFQGDLDLFWLNCQKPNKKTYNQMVCTLKERVLLNASLYSHFKISAERISNHILKLLD